MCIYSVRGLVSTLTAMILIASVPAYAQATDKGSGSTQCVKMVTQDHYKWYANKVYLHRYKVTKQAQLKLLRERRCQHSPKARANVRSFTKELSVRRKAWLISERWDRLFAQLPQNWQAWARSTSQCESSNQRVTKGPFHSYFQWVLSTWTSAGGTGMPEAASWKHQAVLAVRLARREGVQHWPVCGH